MGKPRILIIKGPTYFSPGDEKAFFDWLLSVPCIAGVRGELRNFHINLRRKPSAKDVIELKALFRRYRIPTKVLETIS
jgi:hypothetical protein